MDRLNPINLGLPAISVSISRYAACAVLNNGTLKCWGNSFQGGLGQDNPNDYLDPATVPAIAFGTGIAAQSVHLSSFNATCVLLDNALVKCWGPNAFSQLCSNVDQGANPGLGNDPGEMSQLRAFGVAAESKVKSLNIGDRTVCALLDNGSVKCWGDSAHGEGGAAAACSSPLDPQASPQRSA
jgi:alpha-tubulin suppressor-like RCC1 family protein